MMNPTYKINTWYVDTTSIRTGTGHFGKFGTPILYRYRTLRYVRYINIGTPGTGMDVCTLYRILYRYRYNIDTGTGHFSKFGTSIRYPTLG